MDIGFMQPHSKSPTFFTSSSFLGTSSFPQSPKPTTFFKSHTDRRLVRRQNILRVWLLPVDTCPWTPNIDSENIASQLLGSLSLFPYLGFLYFMTRSKSILQSSLSLVSTSCSLLLGGAESLLSLTNLFILLGLRQAFRRAKDAKQGRPNAVRGIKEEKPSI